MNKALKCRHFIVVKRGIVGPLRWCLWLAPINRQKLATTKTMRWAFPKSVSKRFGKGKRCNTSGFPNSHGKCYPWGRKNNVKSLSRNHPSECLNVYLPLLAVVTLKSRADMWVSSADSVLEDGLTGECACQNQVCISLNLPASSSKSKCVHSAIRKRTGD